MIERKPDLTGRNQPNGVLWYKDYS
jgi:hypothetical protein